MGVDGVYSTLIPQIQQIVDDYDNAIAFIMHALKTQNTALLELTAENEQLKADNAKLMRAVAELQEKAGIQHPQAENNRDAYGREANK